MNGGRKSVRARLESAVARAVRRLVSERVDVVTHPPRFEALEARILFGAGGTGKDPGDEQAPDCPPPADAADSSAPGGMDGAGDASMRTGRERGRSPPQI